MVKLASIIFFITSLQSPGADGAGEQKNFDFLIIGKKAIEMSVGANGQEASRHDPCAAKELSN